MASPEQLWYLSYDDDGRPPTCSRLIRLPPVDQLGMALDLALALQTRQAASMHRTISHTGERFWHWPGAPHARYGDWWLLPERTARAARRATAYAEERATRPRPPTWIRPPIEHGERIRIELQRLRRRAYRAARALARSGILSLPDLATWPKRREYTRQQTILRHAYGIRPDTRRMRWAIWRRREITITLVEAGRVPEPQWFRRSVPWL